MNRNETLIENVLRVKENKYTTLPDGYPEWLEYIRSVKRVADEKEAENYKLRLKQKGITIE